MFTGIVTHIGTVTSIEKSGDWVFTIAAKDFTRTLTMGASIACSGTCLTATSWTDSQFTVQVSQETLRCTTLGRWAEGTRINLERALRVGDELGGHFVTGHVDGLARITHITQVADSQVWAVAPPTELLPFVATKGSVTLDGVSLTVNKIESESFLLNLIPHTQNSTSFADRRQGDMLNMEVDIIARYLMRQKEF